MKLLELFKELTLHPKNAEELKGLILQLAVQGRLTSKWRVLRQAQQPPIEPASVLLARVKKEKAALVKGKAIRKEKARSKITPSEEVFVLPDSWDWTRLGDYIHNLGQKVPEHDFEYIDVGSVDNRNGIINQNLAVISPNDAPSRARKIVKKGCVIYSTVRPYLLNIAVVDREFKNEAIASTAFAILKPLAECSEYYLYQLLRSYYFIQYVESCMKGVAYPAINDANLLNAVLPIPPLEEQKAIVAIVNQLFAEVEQLETLSKERIQLKEDFVVSALQRLSNGDTATEWSFLLDHFKTFFTEKSNVKKLREAVLQLAVQGKLTTKWRLLRQAQQPPLEPASELLKRIKAEKELLIKEKKIKKEKPLPVITKDEIPYELPEGWVWCRMQDVGLFERGKSKHRPRNDFRLFEDGKYPLVQTGDVSSAKDNGGIINSFKSTYNDFGLAQSRMWNSGTLCITIAANIAETGMLGFDACFPDSVVGFTQLVKGNLAGYVEYFITIMKSDLEKYAPSTAQKNINLGILFELKFPLPPLEEQKAIVEKVNTLMGLCDALEQEITKKHTQVQDLMRSSLREVLEG